MDPDLTQQLLVLRDRLPLSPAQWRVAGNVRDTMVKVPSLHHHCTITASSLGSLISKTMNEHTRI